MAADDFNSKMDVEGTRAALGQRLGEIITDLVGNDRIQKLYEAQGKSPGADGASVGEIALKEGVISADTKTALLVAQAAERAYSLSTEAGDLSRNHDDIVKQHRDSGERYETKTAHVVEYTDPVFKFVGSDRDPPLLKQAQAAWMVAQMHYNNEIYSLADRINHPGYVGASASMEGYEGGFQKMAASLYAEAAKMLKAEGHDDAAGKLDRVARKLSDDAPEFNGKTPAGFVSSLLWNEAYAAQQVNIVLNGPYQSVSSEFETRLEQVATFLPPQQPKERVITLVAKPG